MYRTNIRASREDGMNWEIGINMYILLCVKQIVGTYCRAQGTLLSALW